MRNVDSDAPLLLFINSTTRYLLEFFFGNRVAGEVIYYLFEIFKNDTAVYVPLTAVGTRVPVNLPVELSFIIWKSSVPVEFPVELSIIFLKSSKMNSTGYIACI